MTSLLCQKCNFWLKAFFTPQKEHWKKKASEPEAWNRPRSFWWIHVPSDIRLLTLKSSFVSVDFTFYSSIPFQDVFLKWNHMNVALPSLCLLHPMLSGSLELNSSPKTLCFLNVSLLNVVDISLACLRNWIQKNFCMAYNPF